MIMNWLMFTTIMILMMAYGPYGNSTAASLATLALIMLLALSFKAARRSVSLSSSLREERETGTKHRASRRLVNTTENTMVQKGHPAIGKMGEEAHQACSDMVQSGIALATMKFQGGAADAAYLGSMAALGALTPTAMVFANRPRVDDQTIRERGKEIAFSLVKEETLLFAALVAARCQTNLGTDGETTTEFGPHILWQALSIWEKVYPDKKAEDHLDNGMIKAARKFGEQAVVPFDEFLRKRQTSVPPTNSLN